MTSPRDRRAEARARARRGGTPAPPPLPAPSLPGRTSPVPGDTAPARIRPPREPPDRSVATTSDSSLVILPPSGASTTTTGTPWTTVVVGTPHSTPAGGTTPPPASSSPPDIPPRGFAILADDPVTNVDLPTPLPAGDVPVVPPRPLDYDDFEFLLGELTQLGNESATDRACQNDRHAAFLTQLQSLRSAIETQTSLASEMMTAITTLRTQMESTLTTSVEAQNIALAVQSENTTIRASLQDLRVPTHTNIPAAIAQTQATVLASLETMGDDLAQQLDTTIRAHPAFPTSDADDNVESNIHGDTRNTRWPHANASHWTSTTGYDSDAAYAAAHRSPAHNDSPPARSVRLPRHRTDDYGDDLSPRGGNTPSPRQRLTLLKDIDPHILRWHAGTPDGDPIDGTDLMETPDVEALGIDSAFAPEMAEDHLEHIEHWANPRWTSADSRHYGGSYTPSSLSGPSLSDILKQIGTWDKLSDLSATGWQGFYKKLRRYSFKWKISLVPFEAISLKYEYMGHNLCHCGLGLARFRKMGDALFIILENLLPPTNTTIATTLDTLANSPRSANGYELLWTLLKEFIPMLDRTKPTPFPSWSDATDILQYGRLVLMYCDLARHHGPPYTDAMKARMFLTNVRGPYVQLSTQYNAIISTYCPGRDGVTRCSDPLPRHLTVLELAQTLYDTMLIRNMPPQPLQHSAIQAYRASAPTYSATPDGYSATPDGTSITSPMSSVTDPPPPSSVPQCARHTHIQGFSVNLTRRTPPSTGRTAPNPASRPPPPHRYEGTCAACGKYGHEAVRCDMLAMALFLNRYSSDRTNQESIRAAEARWKERNKKFLPRDDRTPRTVLANYCSELNFLEDTVDAELDWSYLESHPTEADSNE